MSWKLYSLISIKFNNNNYYKFYMYRPKQKILCGHQGKLFLHCLRQKQTLLTLPELLALPWNKPKRNPAVFPVTSLRLMSETPLWQKGKKHALNVDKKEQGAMTFAVWNKELPSSCSILCSCKKEWNTSTFFSVIRLKCSNFFDQYPSRNIFVIFHVTAKWQSWFIIMSPSPANEEDSHSSHQILIFQRISTTENDCYSGKTQEEACLQVSRWL